MIQIPRKTYDEAEEERTLLPAGRYLIEIIDAEEQNAGEYVLVKYRTLAPNAGVKSEERFFLSEAALKRFAALCKRAGLVDRGEDSTEALMIDPFDLGGVRMVVDLIQENVTSKKGREYVAHRWDFMGFWKADDPRVADFVRSLQAARRPPAPAQQAAPNGRQPVAATATDDEV